MLHYSPKANKKHPVHIMHAEMQVYVHYLDIVSKLIK